MLQQGLQRDYFFEFAGMPQSGKSTVMEIVAHFLKRNGYPIEEYYGGSRYSRLYNAPIGDLNLFLALKIAEFVTETTWSKRDQHRVFLIDKGLVDRNIFTETLLRLRLVDGRSAQNTKDLLTLPQLLDTIDGVFIFKTSPEIALEREYKDKPKQREGQVMNPRFLSTMLSVEVDTRKSFESLIRNRNLLLIDTEQDNIHLQRTTELIINNIMEIINPILK